MGQLPVRAQKALDRFLRNPNKSMLHQIDWEHFYEFVLVCHEEDAEFFDDDLQRVLRDAGFSHDKTHGLRMTYSDLRELLKYARTRHRRSSS